MKKLMIMFATVAMAAAVQAGAVTWKVNYAVDPLTGNDLNGGLAYLINTADFSASVVEAAIQDGTFVSGGYAAAAVLEDTFADGVVSQANKLNGVYSGATEFFTVILDKDYDFASGGNYIVTAPISQNIGASGYKTYKWDLPGTTSDWSTYGASSPVPEPTSGLLMLLGVAGLALRRRRA